MGKPVYYLITYGFSGCYMPESHYGHFIITTRGELADLVKEALEFYGMPKSRFNAVGIRHLWRRIRYIGCASCLHFSLNHGAYELSFSGLTEDEYEEHERQADMF